MQSFTAPLHVAVIGASGGIGRAFVAALAADAAVARVHACSRRPMANDGKVCGHALDLEDETSIATAASGIGDTPLDLVIVATGVLHDTAGLRPEKTWRHLEAGQLQRAFAVNAIGPALVAKHLLPKLRRDHKAVFAALSARVGSIEDNRFGGWHAYRASKAALNQLLRTLAIELARKRPDAVCVGLHPGTTDTDLSRPFQANVPEGKLFSPDFAAARMLAVIDGLGPADSGGLFAWDGARIPF